MAVIAYLSFKNQSEEVIKFYEKALNGYDVRLMKMSDLPKDPNYKLPKEEMGLIANASIKFEGGMLMISDVPESMGMPLNIGNNVNLSIVLKDSDVARCYFNNLAEGGSVQMPLMATSWSPLYGMVIDKYGIGWQINVTDDDYYYSY